jgi:hypothetical protein
LEMNSGYSSLSPRLNASTKCLKESGWRTCDLGLSVEGVEDRGAGSMLDMVCASPVAVVAMKNIVVQRSWHLKIHVFDSKLAMNAWGHAIYFV